MQNNSPESQFNQLGNSQASWPVMSLVSGALGAVVGAGLYCLAGWFTRNSMFPALLVGPAVGFSMRYIGRSYFPRIGLVAVVFALVASIVGFIIVDQNFVPWVYQPTMKMSFQNLFNVSVLAIGFSAYFAYGIVSSMPRGPIRQSNMPQDSAAQAPSALRCPNCDYGLASIPTAKHCPECGAKLN